MAFPSGRKKGWKPSRRGGATHLNFTLTVWKDRTTPRFSVPILDPDSTSGWLPKNTHQLQVRALMMNIRSAKHLWFMKPLTISTQLLTNYFATKQMLPLVSLGFWHSERYVESLRFENARIDHMNAFTVLKEFRDDDDPGMYHEVSMTAGTVDWYNFAEANKHHIYIQQWRDS